MDRFMWFLDEVLKQFQAIERAISCVTAKIPGLGEFTSGHSNIIALVMIAAIALFIIKPLLKWSFGIVAMGTALAALISHFSGLAFWGVLPLTALAASIVMFSNRFTMG